MKIYLFIPNELFTFDLPTEVSGSFGFDPNPEEERKLINIEASEGKWFIYSTNFSKVIENNNEIPGKIVEPGNFYRIKRDNNSYLIKIEPKVDNTFKYYKYNKVLNLRIGGPQANLVTSNPIAAHADITLTYGQDDKIYYQNFGELLPYINKKVETRKQVSIDYGDQINIFGLKIHILNGFLLINNPNGEVRLNEVNAGLSSFIFEDKSEKLKNEVIDIDLYKEDDYYSKSPRIRRQIESKTFEIENPPDDNKNSNVLPAILTLGPQLTMALTGILRLVNIISDLMNGTTTLQKCWLQLMVCLAAILGSLFWPKISKAYIKHLERDKRNNLIQKYDEYIESKAKDLDAECIVQSEIIKENLYDEYECLNIMNRRGMNFWDKRMDQNDLLVARIGIGDEELTADISFSTSEFDIDKTPMRKKAEAIVESHKIIRNVPIGYSFHKNLTTAIMGEEQKVYPFINNILLQFITYYNYSDLKIVVFTNEKNEKYFDYVKYLNHNFSNDKNFRYFASNQNSAKNLAERITELFKARVMPTEGSEDESQKSFLPYFLIVVDGYDTVKKLGIIDTIVEANMDVGFSLIILENKLSKLPSKCSNFITLGANESRILTNSYDSQASKTFKDEINYNINMMNVAKVLSNIPIEINSVTGGLPQTESFLEMERVGKVEQLNILERWRNNDSTESLRAEIGVNAKNELIYLDLHEKAHGPHGLIAGTTGSGKSEFIITYILSMAINYSPDDIAFILIDYKGGGLAYAFENKTTNVVLPHLAGTITNLDKSEMDRTLVSIDSEVKRRQVLFNKAREITEESTIDIYKYQKHFHNGELTEPCPHLFIICDEFAELKSQQPEFMDDLISIARIGRSLGVHLILATQKPSGQVNEQIWTNTKFRVCLKVQSPGDSREMLKKPDAAFIKEAGRFYLQVGQDEIYIQGQSGWAGAKYFPSDTIVKEADKSINIINDNGFFIKSLKSGSSKKAEAQGEQLSAILNSVISIANQSNKHVPKLWLPSLDSVLLLDYLTQKYNITHEKYQVKGIVGEYDAPEIQEQGILEFNCIEKENTLIYGTEEEEKEFFLKTLLYSMYTNHGPDEINTYIIDYGSESLRIFKNFPHVGEIIGQDDADGLKGIIKLIKKELAQRKKEFIQYGGDYQSYIKNSEKKVPIITLIINGYDAFLEIHKLFTDTLLPIVRECARYGIYVYITLSAVTSLSRRASLCFKSAYSLHLKDESAYRATIPGKSRLVPRKDFARGVINNGAVHEFQTASIVEDKSNLSNVITEKGKELMASTTIRAKEIPKLPEKVTFDMIKDYIKDLSSVPIGIEKETLNISKYNFVQEVANFIVGFKIENINSFMKSIIKVFREIKDLNIILVDPRQTLESMKDLTNNYYSTDMEQNIDLLYDFTENNKELTDKKILFIFHGISLLKDQLPKDNKLDKLFKNIKSNKNMTLVVADGVRNLKNIDFDSWYTNLKNPSEGIWVGRGANEQTVIRMNPIPREASLKVDNNYGFHISDQTATFIKLIELYEDKQIVDEENDIPQEESIEEGEVLNEE